MLRHFTRRFDLVKINLNFIFQPKAYEFGYQVRDDYTGNNYNRQEASDGNQVRGEYRVALPDGRTQIVTYYADWQTGYHADVRYEGTAHYPEQYNNNGPTNNNHQYGGGASGGFQNTGDYASPATSSVSIKDYSSNNGPSYSGGNNYDSYNSGGFTAAGPTPVYGAP